MAIEISITSLLGILFLLIGIFVLFFWLQALISMFISKKKFGEKFLWFIAFITFSLLTAIIWTFFVKKK